MPALGHWAAVAVTHAPEHGVQHTPLVGHVTPAHVTPKPRNVPLHAAGPGTMKHPNTPAAFVPQHAPRQGFGWHEVPATCTPLENGHGTAVEHAPVDGSQQMCVTTHGLICAHVSPSEKISGAAQCVASGWIEHRPVDGSQHAPCVPGGQGFVGAQAVAVTCVVPAGHEVPVAVWHWPVIGLQQITTCGGQTTPTHVEPKP